MRSSRAATAVAAYNESLDATWDAVRHGSVDDLTDESAVCFTAKGPAQAKIPTAFMERSAAVRGVEKQGDGFWHVEQVPAFAATALRIRPVTSDFWDGHYAPEDGFKAPKEEPGNRKVVARSLDAVRPSSYVYGQVHVYFLGVPVELYCWITERGDVFIRRRYSRESWGALPALLREKLLSDPATYLGLPA